MQASPFDYFVVFAEMRTGSNFLESNLNAFDGVTCFGEAFNPHFVGYPNRDDVLGITVSQREEDPFALLQKVRECSGLGGFRYFNDHDPRILDRLLDDPRCAKIILTRNPLDSYISLKIARETDQWKLTNLKRRKDALVEFDMAEFRAHLDQLQRFQMQLAKGLQARGQTPFYLTYEDLQSLQVMNGLARWLGLTQTLDALDDKMKRQNPGLATSKVSNPEEMANSLAEIDTFQLSHTPSFEPRRGPNVRSYVAAPHSPLLFLPIEAGPTAEVCEWIAALDAAVHGALHSMDGQKQLRIWMNAHVGHRSFTVVRHPLLRAHSAFSELLRPDTTQLAKKVQQYLKGQLQIELPESSSEDRTKYRTAFLGFLEFLQRNLNGQTSIRVDARWTSQSTVLSGFEEFCPPDFVFREEELQVDLPYLAQKIGRAKAPDWTAATAGHGATLAAIYDDEIEKKARAVYRRDYMVFGFKDWEPHKP